MKALFNRFVQEESGQDLIEYGLLIGIITSTVVLTVTAIGTKVQEYYTGLQTNLAGGGS
jgi:pilus assembly protein Flp/PilA